MRRASQFEGKKLFTTKTTRKGEEKVVRLGKIRRTVFSEDGSHLVGYIVKQPDIAGMVKRPNLFVAIDSIAPCEGGVMVTRGDESFDDAARERLGVDWDRCIMWVGMDAVTTKGKELGYICDAEYNEKTGEVSAFLVNDGNAAEMLVGNVRIPWEMIKRYEDGKMIVAAAAAKIAPSGGAAGAAGEGFARAKEGAAKAGKKAGKAASDAFDKGTKGLGRLIGKARNAVSNAMADDDPEPIELEDVLVEEPPRELPAKKSAEKPKTYAPKKAVAKKADAKKAETKKAAPKKAKGKKSGASKAAASKPAAAKPAGAKKKVDAKAVGAHINKLGGMFQAFKDEYDKASK